VDLDRGELFTPHIMAAATLALGLPKQGLLVEPGRSACGAYFVGEIGVPPELYARLGLEVGPLFGRDTVIGF
jgi:NAD(P)H-hydrate epimerase